MPVRGQFAAASLANSVSNGSVRASVRQNSRHGGAQEKQEAKRCKDRIMGQRMIAISIGL